MVPLRSSDTLEAKRALRREMRERRERLPEDERRARSEAACARLLALLDAGGVAGKVVAGYVAVRGELDPAAALAGLRARRATVALPRVSDLIRTVPSLTFHAVEAGATLAPGHFGIPEPDGSSLVSFLPGALDVVIVPGLAFDAEGRRVGSGGGYYDSAFSRGLRRARPTLIGFAYDFQIVDRCPADELDVPVEMVVTDARVLQRGTGGLAEPPS